MFYKVIKNNKLILISSQSKKEIFFRKSKLSELSKEEVLWTVVVEDYLVGGVVTLISTPESSLFSDQSDISYISFLWSKARLFTLLLKSPLTFQIHINPNHHQNDNHSFVHN